jgi:signal transduction histidine kinase
MTTTDIILVRDYLCESARSIVDKHKILQILINLVRNAKYACQESDCLEKKITLQLQNGGDLLRVRVKDNGVGIEPGAMQRLFEHGFTTRSTGHGFGLHGSRQFAEEMGGRLVAESDGRGTGATFTLELPCRPRM